MIDPRITEEIEAFKRDTGLTLDPVQAYYRLAARQRINRGPFRDSLGADGRWHRALPEPAPTPAPLPDAPF